MVAKKQLLVCAL